LFSLLGENLTLQCENPKRRAKKHWGRRGKHWRNAGGEGLSKTRASHHEALGATEQTLADVESFAMPRWGRKIVQSQIAAPRSAGGQRSKHW